MWNELILNIEEFFQSYKPIAFLWKIPLNQGKSSMDVANFSSIPKEIN
jgi:hypothetical protein